jgi:putative hydrolase of the HAD superfamily
MLEFPCQFCGRPRLFADETGMPLAQAESWIERHIYHDWVRSFRGIAPYPGLRDLLDRTSRRGLGLAVLSDFPVADKLGYLGLANLFPVALCSEESGYLSSAMLAYARAEARWA